MLVCLSFGQYIKDLAKANGCPFIVKDSKTKSQLYFKFVCKLSGTRNKYSLNSPSYIYFKERGSVISFERSCWYHNHCLDEFFINSQFNLLRSEGLSSGYVRR